MEFIPTGKTTSHFTRHTSYIAVHTIGEHHHCPSYYHLYHCISCIAGRQKETRKIKMSAIVNGYKHESERISHQEEKHLPGGWVVLKFGGTSVGKFAENIAGIVR